MHFSFSHFFVCLFLFSFSNILFADIDELYHLSIGANIENYDSKLSINTNNNNEYSLENSLGFNKQVNTGWISGWYRVGDKHRIKLTYTPIKRTSNIQSTKDITINETTIKSGSTIDSMSKTDIFDFSYIYSLHKTPQLDWGLTAGIYTLINRTQVLAQGEILSDGQDIPVFKTDYSSEQRLQAPMPLFGMSINYEITPSWRSHAAARYLSLKIGEIDGEILSAEIGTEYYFHKNWGAGLALSSFDLNVNSQSIVANTALGWAHKGVQIYAIFKY